MSFANVENVIKAKKQLNTSCHFNQNQEIDFMKYALNNTGTIFFHYRVSKKSQKVFFSRKIQMKRGYVNLVYKPYKLIQLL